MFSAEQITRDRDDDERRVFLGRAGHLLSALPRSTRFFEWFISDTDLPHSCTPVFIGQAPHIKSVYMSTESNILLSIPRHCEVQCYINKEINKSKPNLTTLLLIINHIQ